MTKAQWAAIYNYCEEYGCTKYDLLNALKANGTVGRSTRLEDLGEYANGNTYDAMAQFLGDNLK